MLRRTDILISQVRRQSENTDFSNTTGISDEEIIQYLNDAQHRLQTVILSQHPAVFLTEVVQNVVGRQEIYLLPSNAYLGNKVTNVDYSYSGSDRDYTSLSMGNLKNRFTGIYGDPNYYIRQSGKLILSPTPDRSQAKLRITYVKRIDQIDIRRGIISNVTLTGNTVTNLVGDLSSPTYFDIENLQAAEYVCIVDNYGNIKMRNLPLLSIDSALGTLNIDPAFTFQDGETISVGDYIVIGKDTSTHSELERNCERYLLTYAAWRLMRRDSSVDAPEENNELTTMENEIAAAYAEVNDDIIEIPIIQEW